MSPHTINYNHPVHMCQQAFFFLYLKDTGKWGSPQLRKFLSVARDQQVLISHFPGAGEGLMQDAGEVKGWRKETASPVSDQLMAWA